jgi:hypothetical protein
MIAEDAMDSQPFDDLAALVGEGTIADDVTRAHDHVDMVLLDHFLGCLKCVQVGVNV